MGLVLARKPNKLPRETISVEYSLEYGKNVLCVNKDAFNAGDKVIIIDDLLATGGSSYAMEQLVEQEGATVACFAYLINLRNVNDDKFKLGAKVFSVLNYGVKVGDKVTINCSDLLDIDQLRYNGEKDVTVVGFDGDKKVNVTWDMDDDARTTVSVDVSLIKEIEVEGLGKVSYRE